MTTNDEVRSKITTNQNKNIATIDGKSFVEMRKTQDKRTTSVVKDYTLSR